MIKFNDLVPFQVILNGNGTDDEELFPGYLRKLCAFLGSIYAFFVLEMILSIRHDHSHILDTDQELIKSVRYFYQIYIVILTRTDLILLFHMQHYSTVFLLAFATSGDHQHIRS